MFTLVVVVYVVVAFVDVNWVWPIYRCCHMVGAFGSAFHVIMNFKIQIQQMYQYVEMCLLLLAFKLHY